ncbi:NADH--cytochrome b5 reductase 1 [Morella rubra]|uniref:cytochrome-b5 reductase n=1 Tax=Morella rubra TaxID=262757 RepID=A0A6A1UP73_9ROSI|nr:NADH--cytochrome b5 reductase 1 [Morella rubra]
MEFMPTPYSQLRGIAVALAVVGTAAAYLYYSKKPKGCLNPEKFIEFKLVKKTRLSRNIARFRFALPTPTSVLGLPVGHYIKCRGKDREGQELIRPFTPITLDSDVGYFDLVVKMYPTGRMSHHFREMREGDYLPVMGPEKGRFEYKPGQVRAFGMLAGGSGICPMFQLIRAILENPKDKTNVHLIYANVSVDDTMLKPPTAWNGGTGFITKEMIQTHCPAPAPDIQEELDSFASKFPNRLKVYYVLEQPPTAWNGGTGFITKEMIQTHCPAPAPDIQILRCGPPAMNKAMEDHLNALGYTSDMQFEF